LPVLRNLLPSITTPAQIIAGREDDLVPWTNNEYLADLLPNSEIPSAGCRPLHVGGEFRRSPRAAAASRKYDRL
jgi:pimeloyl-ACP methyl ester carboxylesterase